MDIESASYVLFGRVLPSLRHALVGELQALRFGVAMARASLLAGEGDNSALAAIGRASDSTDRSIARAMALSAWLQPGADDETEVSQAVEECLALVHTEWRIRGIEATARVAGGSTRARSWPLRQLLAAMLVALGDSLEAPADVMLLVRPRGAFVLLAARARLAQREADGPRAAWPRVFGWQDLDALVRLHAASCHRSTSRVEVRVPAH